MRLLATTLAAAALGLVAVAPVASARDRWDTKLLAVVPPPGYPAHAYVHPDGRIYEGTYVNSGSTAPSQVLEYDGDGTVLRSFTIQGQSSRGDQGVQAATSDALGRIVVLDHSPPRVLTLDRADGTQRTYATFPGGGSPNYAAWGPGGELYVTDYAANLIWRVPPGGGEAERWFSDPRLATIEFGMTGLELAADQKSLLFAQQTTPAFGGLPNGGLFSLPITADGKPGPLSRIWQSGVVDLPDGFAIARSGRIYVATLGPNQIVTLDPKGAEVERFPTLPLVGENGSPVPFDALSSVAFRGTSLITASQSNPRGDATHWAIHDVETGEPGLPELLPLNAGGAHPIAVAVTPTRVRAGRNVRLRVSASVGGRPVPGAAVKVSGRSARTGADGRATLRLRVVKRGLRTVKVTAAGLTEGRARFRVRRP